MIPFNELSATDVVFTHRDPVDGKVRMFNITRLQKIVDFTYAYGGIAPVNIAVVEEDKPIFENRGLEPHRLARITAPFPPILVCQMPDDTSLIVDGNHRFFKCYELGLTDCPAFLIHQSIWEKCLIDLSTFPLMNSLNQDAIVDDVFLAGFSGIS